MSVSDSFLKRIIHLLAFLIVFIGHYDMKCTVSMQCLENTMSKTVFQILFLSSFITHL